MFKKVFISGVSMGLSLSVCWTQADELFKPERIPKRYNEGETVQCEALGNEGGNWGVKIKCGEGPHNIGYIHQGTFVRKIHLLLKDRETGQTRRHFFDVATTMKAEHIPKGRLPNKPDYFHYGGFAEVLGGNANQRADGLPIALYMPGEFGSSYYAKKFFGSSTDNILNELKEEEELSWLSSLNRGGRVYDTAWRGPVPGIKDSEDVLDIRYELDADMPALTEAQYKKEAPRKPRRTLKSLSTKTTLDEFFCRTYEEQLSFNCKTTKKKYCISPSTGGWCQAPNGREAVFVPLIACITGYNSPCPPITDCVFSEKSIYFDSELRKTIITKNWLGYSDSRKEHSSGGNEDTHNKNQREGGAGQ